MKRLYKILVSTICLAIFLVSFFQGTIRAADKDIIILYTNDIHCAITENENIASLAQYKLDQLEKTPYVALVDAGDAIQGSSLGSLTNGQAIVQVMNKVGYDFVIPGNHEFDFGMENFLALTKEMRCGYYCANFMNLEKQQPVLPSYKMMTFGDTKVAFIGVTTPETLSSANPRSFKNAQGQYIYGFCEDNSGKSLYKTIQKNVNAVRRQGADYVILVGHLGVVGIPYKWSSIGVAANLKGVDAIIDGHSHEIYPAILVKDKRGRRTLVTQTGSHLRNIGQLTISKEGNLSVDLVNSLDKTYEPVAKLIREENAKFEELLHQPIGEALVPLYTDDPVTGLRLVRKQETNMGDYAADAMRRVLDADVGIINSGAIRHSLPKGVVSYQEFFQVFPFMNTCIVKEVSGQQLLDALEVGAEALPQESGAFLQVSGMRYTVNTNVPSSVVFDDKGGFVKVAGKYRVQDVYVGQEKLQLDKKYTVAGNTYILRDGGNGMTMFNDCEVVQQNNMVDIDLLLEYLQNYLDARIGDEYGNPYGEGRIKII